MLNYQCEFIRTSFEEHKYFIFRYITEIEEKSTDVVSIEQICLCVFWIVENCFYSFFFLHINIVHEYYNLIHI